MNKHSVSFFLQVYWLIIDIFNSQRWYFSTVEFYVEVEWVSISSDGSVYFWRRSSVVAVTSVAEGAEEKRQFQEGEFLLALLLGMEFVVFDEFPQEMELVSRTGRGTRIRDTKLRGDKQSGQNQWHNILQQHFSSSSASRQMKGDWCSPLIINSFEWK